MNMDSYNKQDCIVGVATGTPDGGVAVIRLSGGRCESIGATLIGSLPKPRQASVRTVRALDGRALDDALVLWMPGPASFTGEDVLELHAHAGEENVRQLLSRCLEAGARLAVAGEFSRRAFERGKLSLEQVEALPGLLSAESSRSLSRARRLLRGELGEQIEGIVQKLFTLRVEVEAHLDFPEDTGLEDKRRWVTELGQHRLKLGSWIASHRANADGSGRFRVVIAGPPNAGKSSLFNRLVGKQRSIVSDQAGTTRDYVEAGLRWEGMALDLVDTAGIRSQADALEAEGIRLGEAEMASADLVLWVCAEDLTEPGPGIAEMGACGKLIRVASKRDRFPERNGWLSVSVMDGHESSITLLRDEIHRVQVSAGLAQEDDWIGLDRHARCVQEADDALASATSLLEEQEPGLELVAFDLGSALHRLGAIRGRDAMQPVGEEVLHAIFSSFCIGK